MKKSKELKTYSIEDIKNPEIEDSKIVDIILNGDVEELELLGQNNKFENFNSELLLSMAKIKELEWHKQVKNQTLMSIVVLLLGLFVFKFYNSINLIIFSYTVYLFYFKSKKEQLKEQDDEKTRLEYIIKIIQNTELKYLPLDKVISSVESHIHKP